MQAAPVMLMWLLSLERSSLQVYDPLPAHQLAKAEDTAFSASSLHTMVNSAYRENDLLSEQLQQQKQVRPNRPTKQLA